MIISERSARLTRPNAITRVRGDVKTIERVCERVFDMGRVRGAGRELVGVLAGARARAARRLGGLGGLEGRRAGEF